MTRAPLTVLITACDEAERIGTCLASVAWADQILVVDSGSTDRTREIARAAGAEVLEHPYVSPSRQKNWALPRCRHEWVLILDADERVTPALRREIETLLAGTPAADAYAVRRVNVAFGRPVRFGRWARDRVVRLVRRDRARYDDRRVHEEIVVAGRAPRLRGTILHDACRSLEEYWPKMVRYAAAGADEVVTRGRRVGLVAIVGRPLWRFARSYLLDLGILDGRRGAVLAGMSAVSAFLKYALAWERRGAAGRQDAAMERHEP